MPTPRRMTREARRAWLLDAAAVLVDEAGAGALTFEAIAKAAGVAASLPYAYFTSRDEVLVLLFDRVIGGLDEMVEAVLVGEEDFETVVRRSLEVWFDAARDHGRLVGALLDGGAVPGLATAVRRRDQASHDLWRGLAASRFSLGDSEADVLAAMVNRSATATIELWLTRRGSRQDLVDAFVAMVAGAAAGLVGR